MENLTLRGDHLVNQATNLGSESFPIKKITLLVTGMDENLDKASRNLRDVYLVDAAKVSTYDIIDCDTLVVDKASMKVLTDILAG